MTIKQYLKLDENAVSPVIGVILLVAITVMMSTVIGAYSLGFSDKLSHSCDMASFTDSITGNTTDYAANTTGGNETDGNETEEDPVPTEYDVSATVVFLNTEQIEIVVSGGGDIDEVDAIRIYINGMEFVSVCPDDVFKHPRDDLPEASWMLPAIAPAFEQPIVTEPSYCQEHDVDYIGDATTNHVIVTATFPDGAQDLFNGMV